MTIDLPTYHMLLIYFVAGCPISAYTGNFLAILCLFDAHLDQVGRGIFGALRWRRSGDCSMHGRKETLRATTPV